MTFGKRVDGPAGRRRIIREEVVLAGSAQSMKTSRQVVITDVSAGGAKLIGRGLDRLDSDVLISIGGVELFASLAWSHPDECGVAFEEPLGEEMIHFLKNNAQWAHVVGIRP